MALASKIQPDLESSHERINPMLTAFVATVAIWTGYKLGKRHEIRNAIARRLAAI